MNRSLISLLPLVLAVGACSREAPSAPEATGSQSATATTLPIVPASTPSVPTADEDAIPAAMRGRFGLVPADCMTTRGDDKGRLTVRADSLRFYESVATLAKASERRPNRLKAMFAYSGEGMEWRREASLELRNGGKTLILEEFGDDAVPGPRTYTRCSS